MISESADDPRQFAGLRVIGRGTLGMMAARRACGPGEVVVCLGGGNESAGSLWGVARWRRWREDRDGVGALVRW
jgi:hypothetical protein